MKYLVVCGIVLILSILGPQQNLDSSFDSLWALGALAILSFVCHQTAAYFRLPLLVGWIAAGLVLGTSGLQIVRPAEQATVDFLLSLAAVWVGFQVGIRLAWPRGLNWSIIAVVGLATITTFVLATAGFVVIAKLPFWLALFLGSIASLWGPIAVSAVSSNKSTLLLTLIGSGFSLVILSVVLIALYLQGSLPVEAPHAAGKIWLGFLAGAIGMEILRRLGLFFDKTSTLLAGLCCSLVLAALMVDALQLYALPFGLGAGLTLSYFEPSLMRARNALEPMGALALMLFFPLLGATIDLAMLWPLSSGIFMLLLVQVLAPVLVRGVGLLLWQPGSLRPLNINKHSGWLILPKGALLFELIYRPRDKGLLEVLPESWTRLFYQVALVDLLIHIFVFSTLALMIQRLIRHPAQAPSSNQEEEVGSP